MTRPASTPAAEATARMGALSCPVAPPDPERRGRGFRRTVRARCGDRAALRGTAWHARAPGGPGGDPRERAACPGLAAAARGPRGGGAVPGRGPGGSDRGDAGEGNDDHDGPAVRGDVRPGPPDPGRAYRAPPPLRPSPG